MKKIYWNPAEIIVNFMLFRVGGIIILDYVKKDQNPRSVIFTQPGIGNRQGEATDRQGDRHSDHKVRAGKEDRPHDNQCRLRTQDKMTYTGGDYSREDVCKNSSTSFQTCSFPVSLSISCLMPG